MFRHLVIISALLAATILTGSTKADDAEMKAGDESIATPIEHTDALTGRKLIQLTSGDWFDYPLYYFIPTVTSDSKNIIFHRYRNGNVQYHRLDVTTGKVTCLTSAKTPNSLWRPWEAPSATGVREFLGAFCPATNELVYFDSNDIHAVHIFTLKDRVVATLPNDRVPCGLTGISPDGRYFCFPHADRSWWETTVAKAGPERDSAHGVRIELLDLSNGQMRPLISINSWITHTNFYDNQRILFCHPATESGMLMTDLRGGWYASLRAQSTDNRQVVHYLATKRGVAYEFNTMGEIDRRQGVIGLCSPETMDHTEFPIDARITHLGMDPEGKLWFGEQLTVPLLQRQLGYFSSLRPDTQSKFNVLTSPLITYGIGQKSHTHPLLMPDRQHILFTGGDAQNKTNHLFLLDVSDLHDTLIEGVK